MNKFELEAINKIVNLQVVQEDSSKQGMKTKSDKPTDAVQGRIHREVGETQKSAPVTSGQKRTASIDDTRETNRLSGNIQRDSLVTSISFIREVASAMDTTSPKANKYEELEKIIQEAKDKKLSSSFITAAELLLKNFGKRKGI